MAGYSNLDFLADQLRSAAPEFEWDAAGVDRARELASILMRHGVKDLGRLAIIAFDVERRDYSYSEPIVSREYAFTYDGGPTFGFMGTQDRHDVTPYFQESGIGPLIAWSAAGHGHVNYTLRPTVNGIALVPLWGSSSDADTIRRHLKGVGTVALMVASAGGLAAGATIGAAIVGPTTAAAYPAATSALGNTLLATAFNGGDLKSALKSVLLSYIGGAAGGFTDAAVARYTSVDALGAVAGSATSAYIRGADLKEAILTTALREAPGAVANIQEDTMSNAFSSDIFAAPGDTYGIDFEPIALDGAGWTFGTPDLSFDWSAPVLIPDPVIGTGDIGVDPIYSDTWADFIAAPPAIDLYPGSTMAPTPAISPEPMTATAPVTPDSPMFDTSKVISTVTGAALSALQIVKAYRALDQPTINTTARTTTASGAVVAASSDGTIRTRRPDGSIATSRPPVGQPQMTVDGFVIVNNGDGTYTRISPTGASQTLRYTDAGGFSIESLFSSPTALALLAGGAFLLFRRKG